MGKRLFYRKKGLSFPDIRINLINNYISDDTYEKSLKVLRENYLAEMTTAINIIKGWRRISIATGMMPSEMDSSKLIEL